MFSSSDWNWAWDDEVQYSSLYIDWRDWTYTSLFCRVKTDYSVCIFKNYNKKLLGQWFTLHCFWRMIQTPGTSLKVSSAALCMFSKNCQFECITVQLRRTRLSDREKVTCEFLLYSETCNCQVELLHGHSTLVLGFSPVTKNQCLIQLNHLILKSRLSTPVNSLRRLGCNHFKMLLVLSQWSQYTSFCFVSSMKSACFSKSIITDLILTFFNQTELCEWFIRTLVWHNINLNFYLPNRYKTLTSCLRQLNRDGGQPQA